MFSPIFVSYFGTFGETTSLTQKAYYTCLHFYDMAIPPIEHHTDITALAATQKIQRSSNMWMVYNNHLNHSDHRLKS